MKNTRIVYSEAMARHLWAHSTDRTIKAACSNAMHGDAMARAEVLRTYTKLVKEGTVPPLPQPRRSS